MSRWPQADDRTFVMMRATIDTASGCWNWNLSITRDGYGKTKRGGRNYQAHRFSYAAFVGPISPDLVLDHLCRNRACVNPDHLEAVTDRVNRCRGLVSPDKTECAQGHEFTPENTYQYRGKRGCRNCRASAAAQYRERKSA